MHTTYDTNEAKSGHFSLDIRSYIEGIHHNVYTTYIKVANLCGKFTIFILRNWIKSGWIDYVLHLFQKKKNLLNFTGELSSAQ